VYVPVERPLKSDDFWKFCPSILKEEDPFLLLAFTRILPFDSPTNESNVSIEFNSMAESQGSFSSCISLQERMKENILTEIIRIIEKFFISIIL
jgi:hypothetical protein